MGSESRRKGNVMKKDAILYTIIGVLVGFLIGYFVGRAHLAYEFKKGVKDAFGAVAGDEDGEGLFSGFKINSQIQANHGAASATLKTLNAMFSSYKKKGYAGLGRIYPVGNDPTVPNDGKFCGLYYEVNNALDRITLIGKGEAAADCRADGNIEAAEGEGSYIPSIYIEAYTPQPELKFECKPKQGYWYALMKFYQDGEKKVPYDKGAARNHFAIVAFPAEYGKSGEEIFIINEEGTVYSIDFGQAKYIDTYPGPDPTKSNWEIAR
jgi:hypothetical protein